MPSISIADAGLNPVRTNVATATTARAIRVASLLTPHSSRLCSEQLEAPAAAEHGIAQPSVNRLFAQPDAQERAEKIVARNRQHVLTIDVDPRADGGDEIDVHRSAALQDADFAHHAIQV